MHKILTKLKNFKFIYDLHIKSTTQLIGKTRHLLGFGSTSARSTSRRRHRSCSGVARHVRAENASASNGESIFPRVVNKSHVTYYIYASAWLCIQRPPVIYKRNTTPQILICCVHRASRAHEACFQYICLHLYISVFGLYAHPNFRALARSVCCFITASAPAVSPPPLWPPVCRRWPAAKVPPARSRCYKCVAYINLHIFVLHRTSTHFFDNAVLT